MLLEQGIQGFLIAGIIDYKLAEVVDLLYALAVVIYAVQDGGRYGPIPGERSDPKTTVVSGI